MSGVSSMIPLELQIETVFKIKTIKKIGFFFNPQEKNSEVISNQLSAIAKDFNFEIVDFRSPPESKLLKKNLQKLINKSIIVDAVYLPSDSFMISNASLLGRQLRIAKIMSIGAVREYLDNGALIGIIADYYQLGKIAARIVDKHQKGEKLENIPIQTIKKPLLMINETTRKLLNIKIPDELLNGAVIIK